MVRFFAAIAAVAVAVAGSAHAASNLIVNGDFSVPDTGGGYVQVTAIPGWTSNTGDKIEVGTSTIYGLPCINAGCQHLEVNSSVFGSVSQAVTGLRNGQSYLLSYDYGGRAGFGPQVLDVSFGGAAVASTTNSIGVWTPYRFRLTAGSTSEMLTFASERAGGSPTGGNEVTNVVLTAVPEPASWVLMVGGFGLVGIVSRRRRGGVFITF